MFVFGGVVMVNVFMGMNIIVVGFLILIGVIVYIMVGGLKAIFLASYIYIVIIFVIFIIFIYIVYVVDIKYGFGFLSKVYDFF